MRDYSSLYGSRVDSTDPAFPTGKALDRGIPGTGTPAVEAWVNDIWGFHQALLDAADGSTANGDEEGVGQGQLLDAVLRLLVGNSGAVFSSITNMTSGSTLNGQTVPATEGQKWAVIQRGLLQEFTVTTSAADVDLGGGLWAQLDAVASDLFTTELLTSSLELVSGVAIPSKGWSQAGEGAALWAKTGVTGGTPSQTPSQLNDGKLTDGNGDEWALVFDGQLTPYDVGYERSVTTSSNTSAFKAAVTAAKSKGARLQLAAGVHALTEQIDLDDRLSIYGNSRQDCQIFFTGTPVTTVQTYKTWRIEYDSGDFTSSSDDALAVGFKVTGAQVHIQDVRITGDATYTTPAPVSTPLASYPVEATYAAGVMQQVTDFSMTRVTIDGEWGLGGHYVDGSKPTGNTANDRGAYYNCKYYGRYGLRIEGAYGQPVSGDDYLDLAASDTRGAGGVSDLGFYNCQFFDSHFLVETDLGNRYVRQADSGALFIHGQVEANSAKRIQGIRFYNCRAACVKDQNILRLNYCNRVEFSGLHTEKASGTAYDTDGTTSLSVSDFRLFSTGNSQNLKFFAGEKSGETDALTYSDGTDTLISLFARDDGTTPSESLIANNLKDSGAWTPVVAGASVAGSQTYSNQTGRYTRIGSLVFAQCRVSLSLFDGATSGNIQVRGLPYTCVAGSGNEVSGSVGFLNNLNLNAGYTQLLCSINDGNDYFDLWQAGDNVGASQINAGNFNSSTGVFLSIVYETSEPTGV